MTNGLFTKKVHTGNRRTMKCSFFHGHDYVTTRKTLQYKRHYDAHKTLLNTSGATNNHLKASFHYFQYFYSFN